ncbi:MAG: glycosyltransferase [Alphaproteobacteria bacterium]|nr:glycosyltransferase [Alphaproteobacteria bacterium]
MIDTPLTSVLMSSFNRADYIAEALDSILAQTCPPLEIIVVDDGSTDNTPEILERYKDRVTILRKENGGKAAALNLAMPQANGEFIWVFDDDDLAAPDALETMQNILLQNKDAGIVIGKYEQFKQSHAAVPINPTPLHYHEILEFQKIYVSLLERCYVFQPGMLVRKSCYAKAGEFNEKLARSQDYEMLLRLAAENKIIALDKVLFCQRVHSGMRGTAKKRFKEEESLRVWRQYDQTFFTKIYQNTPLETYLPVLPDTQNTEEHIKITALLQRAVLMGRKGLWELCASDIESVMKLAEKVDKTTLTQQERRILRKLLIENPYALDKEDDAEQFFRVWNTIPSSQLKKHMARNLIWALPYWFKTKMSESAAEAYKVLKGHDKVAQTCGVMSLLYAKPLDKLNK